VVNLVAVIRSVKHALAVFVPLLVAFFTLGGAPAGATPWANLADPVFVRIDDRELPDSDVYSIAQDSAGFVWVGTAGGLARFDGYHF
jgi:hypothetical protein